MKDVLKLAIEASLVAGQKIMEIYNSDNFDVETKSDNSPLTKADKASHEVIMSFLSKTDIPVLSEEGREMNYEERKPWNTLWIVDPIDGTKEFIKKNGEFTVNIALVENQKVVMGVVYAPVLNELYYGAKDMGSFLANTSNETNVDQLMDDASKLPLNEGERPFTVVASRSHLSEETKTYIQEIETAKGKIDMISVGSSLKLCMVARGKADCYPRFAPTMEWDTAAGQAVCTFAGADVMDYNTKDTMLYNRENLLNNWFIVSRD